MDSHRKFHGITEWPMTKETANSEIVMGLHSPRAGNFHGVEPISYKQYAEEVEEIERVRHDVTGKRWPAWWYKKHGMNEGLSPLLKRYLQLSEKRPDKCARVVRMDHPFDLWDLVIEPYLVSEGVKLRKPVSHKGIPFTERVAARAFAHCVIQCALDKGFDIKWAIGQSRIDETPLSFGQTILMYPRPPHPEDVAGHGCFCGAAAIAAQWLYVPNEEQIAQIVLACKQFASFRGFSAMHIWSSNMRGYDVGYTITKKEVLTSIQESSLALAV